MYLHTKTVYLGRGILKLSGYRITRLLYRQTNRQTHSTEDVTTSLRGW